MQQSMPTSRNVIPAASVMMSGIDIVIEGDTKPGGERRSRARGGRINMSGPEEIRHLRSRVTRVRQSEPDQARRDRALTCPTRRAASS
jgi:hypothetical protein